MRMKMRMCMCVLSDKGYSAFTQTKKTRRSGFSKWADDHQRAYMPHQKT